MTTQQHGLARAWIAIPIATMSGSNEPAALAEDVRRLAETVRLLQTRILEQESRMIDRLNVMILSGTLAQRPAAGIADRIFLATDQAVGSNAFFDTGTAWVLM